MPENPSEYVAEMRTRGSFLDVVTAQPHMVLEGLDFLPYREDEGVYTPLGLGLDDWEYYINRCTFPQESLFHLCAG